MVERLRSHAAPVVCGAIHGSQDWRFGNFHPVSIAFGEPLDVTGRLRRENELVVTVVNVYRNRFIGDLAQYGEVRNLKTSSPIQQFLAADKPLARSGLFGPIRVVRIRRQRLSGL